MRFHIVHTYVPSDEMRDHIAWQANQIASIRNMLMTVTAEVQTLLDKARQNRDLVKSIHLRQEAQTKMIADLQAKVDALPAGNVLSQDDKEAVLEGIADLSEANSTLTADTTANVAQPSPSSPPSGSSDPSAGSSTQSGDASSGSAAASSDASAGTQTEDSSAAKPLPGTGQG